MRRICLAGGLAAFVFNVGLAFGQTGATSASKKTERARIAAEKKELIQQRIQQRALNRRAEAQGVEPLVLENGAAKGRLAVAALQAKQLAQNAALNAQQGNDPALANFGQGAGLNVAGLLQNPQALQQFVGQLGQTFGQGFAQGFSQNHQFSGYGFPVIGANFGQGIGFAQASHFGQNLRSFGRTQLGAFPALQGRLGGFLHR